MIIDFNKFFVLFHNFSLGSYYFSYPHKAILNFRTYLSLIPNLLIDYNYFQRKYNI